MAEVMSIYLACAQGDEAHCEGLMNSLVVPRRAAVRFVTLPPSVPLSPEWQAAVRRAVQASQAVILLLSARSNQARAQAYVLACARSESKRVLPLVPQGGQWGLPGAFPGAGWTIEVQNFICSV